MASSAATDIEYRRWLVAGTVLNRVLMPHLRSKIRQEMILFYQKLVVNYGIDKQTYRTRQKTIPPSTLKLNYESINNNAALLRDKLSFDCCVKDEVSLAKLFMKPFMAHFTAFDTSFDASAALAVLCNAPPFSSAAPSAELVRSEVRNDWAHCDFASWTEVKYNTCFDRMETLFEDLGFAAAVKTELVGHLQLWRKHGLEFCVGKPLDETFLNLIRDEVVALSRILPDRLDENTNQLREMLKSVLGQTQAILLKLSRGKHEDISGDFSVSTSEEKSIVFDAPDQNGWFTGRQKELESLEKYLALENSDRSFRRAAICGLGGCGKTTLAAQFAWIRKSLYNGGVFWFSMEDEEKLDSCVTDLAVRLGLRDRSSDVTLAQILKFISQLKEKWLIVLDNVDQPVLSEKMLRVLTGKWTRQSNGHMLITTRREMKEIANFSFELNCCVEISSFSIEDAKKFLLSRFDGENAAGQEDSLSKLALELGCLPLALEQAGAHIKSLQCSVNKYLEQYKVERLLLLIENQANPSREFDSLNRLSVHTTWLMNFDHVKSEKYGEIATRFIRAAAFLDPDDIHEGLINAKVLYPDAANKKKGELPLTNNHVVKVLTKFSLFQRKSVGCMKLHRVVQQVIRGRMASKEIATTMCTAFHLLKSAALSAGKSVTDMSDFSIIRHWSILKRHMQEHVEAEPDGFKAEELSRLIECGANEVVFAVPRTLEGSEQKLENRRRLSALLDNDYDRWLGGRDVQVPRRRTEQPTTATVMSRSDGLEYQTTLGSRSDRVKHETTLGSRSDTPEHETSFGSRSDTLGHQTTLGSRSDTLGHRTTRGSKSDTLGGHQTTLGGRSDKLEHEATVGSRSDTLRHQTTLGGRSDTLEHQTTFGSRSDTLGNQTTLESRSDTLEHYTTLGSRSDTLEHQTTLESRSDTLEHQTTPGRRSDTLGNQTTLESRSDTLEHHTTLGSRSATLDLTTLNGRFDTLEHQPLLESGSDEVKHQTILGIRCPNCCHVS